MTEPAWIDVPEALAIHARLIDDHGGAAGVRDLGSLHGALARLRQRHAYDDPDICDLAAAYAFGIIRDHPFLDGNKRVGFTIAALFLELNDHCLFSDEAEATRAVLALAAGEVGEKEFADWLRSNCTPVRK